jgi:condensation domain-containing protein
MWFLQKVNGGSIYVDPMTFRLHGALDVDALRRGITRVRARHEALRSTFTVGKGGPVQRVSADAGLDMPVHDLSLAPAEDREARLAALLAEDVRLPFDIVNGPVMRAMVVRMSPRDHVLRLTTHHLVSDAWSWWRVILRELSATYRAELGETPTCLAPPTAQYADFVRWQERWCAGPAFGRELDYWTRRLSGLTDLPRLDLGGTGTGPRAATTQWLTVPRPSYDALKEVSRRERVSLFMLLLSAFSVCLHWHSGATDVAVGTRAAMRCRPEFRGTVGLLVNVLVIRATLDRGGTFRELLYSVKRSCLAAYANRSMPFEMVVRRLRAAEGGGSRPTVNVMFSFQSTPEVPPDLPGVDSTLVNHDPQTVYDLDLVCYEEHSTLRALLSHNGGLHSGPAATRVLADLSAVLHEVAEDIDVPLTALSRPAAVVHSAR